MTITKYDASQDNLLDGSILVMSPQDDGAHVTVAGRNDAVSIIAFDMQDLARLARLFEQINDGTYLGVEEDERIRITPLGIEWLRVQS